MVNLLHIDSSILGPNSVSRALSAQIVAKLQAEIPGLTIVRRDLAETPIPHLSGSYLAAAQSPQAEHDMSVAADLALGSAVMQEFLDADIVVIGVALYNFSVSSQLKAWIDRILVAGKTFKYGEDGRPVGLAGGKRAILAIARGGIYAAGSPAAGFEHGESYMRSVLGFIGIGNPEVIVAEGLAMGPDHRQAAVEAAKQHIDRLAA
jgi:FMN-dependent NADH-azoreductase